MSVTVLGKITQGNKDSTDSFWLYCRMRRFYYRANVKGGRKLLRQMSKARYEEVRCDCDYIVVANAKIITGQCNGI